MTESNENIYKPPEEELSDKAHTVGRALTSFVPGGSELFTYLVTPQLERRLIEWRRLVGEEIHRLSQKQDINLDDLQQNDKFIDAVVSATQVAIRTSQEEKREALKNAILNTVLETEPDESLQQMFISFIDEFTVWHLKLLDLFDDPRAWIQRNDSAAQLKTRSFGSLEQLMLDVFPELQGKREFYDQVWTDLNNRGLVNTPSLQGMMSSQGVMAPRVTDMGKRFSAFVKGNTIKTT
jgi:hypothetical protein